MKSAKTTKLESDLQKNADTATEGERKSDDFMTRFWREKFTWTAKELKKSKGKDLFNDTLRISRDSMIKATNGGKAKAASVKKSKMK